MANPQPTDAYGIIAHEIQENLITRDFTEQQLKIIYLIIRLSWGCGLKAWQYDTYKDFEAVGLYKTAVAGHLKYLNNNRVIEWIEKYNLLIFNKDYEQWNIPISKKSSADSISKLVHESLKKANEVTNLLTMLQKKTNGVTKKNEQIDSATPTATTDTGPPKESIKESIKYNMSIDTFFESVWQLYPRKEGKGQVKAAQKKKLYKIGYDELARAVQRYKYAKEGTDRKYLQMGSTFFNSGYVDYLDDNYAAADEETGYGKMVGGVAML